MDEDKFEGLKEENDEIVTRKKKEGIQKKEVYKICLNLKKNEKNY